MPRAKRLAAAAAVASVAVAVGGLAATAVPAHADEWDSDLPCTIDNFSPRSVTVGTSPVVKTFGVSTSDCDLKGWSVDDADGYLFYTYDGNASEVIDPQYNSEAGSRDVIVEASNADWDTEARVFANGFTLKRATHFSSFNAGPEPVKKGKNMTIKGKLLVADWDNDRYVGMSNRTVSVQFRSGTSTWKTVKHTTTGKAGLVNTTIKASKTGSWRLVYGGTSTTGSSIGTSDAVIVKK